jgi:hypothetical protein
MNSFFDYDLPEENAEEELQRWLDDCSGKDWHWYAKFLSGNDTLLTGGHQAGPYVPKQVIFELFPSIADSSELNPRVSFPVRVDPAGDEVVVTAIWYNNRVLGSGTRNEARLTNWGGRASPLLDPESTGSLCLMAFHRPEGRDAEACRVWLCQSAAQEDIVLDRIGDLEPGRWSFISHSDALDRLRRSDSPCRLNLDQIPPPWLLNFPMAREIVEYAAAQRPGSRRLDPDRRLLVRRDCEYEVFRSIEEAWVLPRLREGLATVDLFVGFANAVTNRRKARSGASLELQLRIIFDEEGLAYSHQAVTEGRKRPDFLFPSAQAYHEAESSEGLRILAVKTTCKDRWRQILNEADKLPIKYLLTLQEGVSDHQFREMRSAGVILVVPSPLMSTYPQTVRTELISVSDFIREARSLRV